MPRPLEIAALFCLLAGPLDAESAAESRITVDGELTVEEWQEGADQPVEGEGWVRLARRDDGLYLAVRSNLVGMVDVMVQRGEALHQLHVSGQVGAALFERGEDDLWRLTRTYPWLGEVRSQKAFEAHREERRSALRRRLMAKGLKPPAAKAPEPPAAVPGASAQATSRPAPRPPVSTPPAPKPERPTSERPSPPPKATADPEALAEHLEEHGWKGTQSSDRGSKTAELFLSSEFLRSGDRILVMWPHRGVDKSFTTLVFPADASPMPEGHSAAHATEPFALDFENWFVFDQGETQ